MPQPRPPTSADAGRAAVIFTDLDGTLLDRRTYRAGPAAALVRRLGRHGIPVVFCSAKTWAEQQPLRRRLGVEAQPFIVENGSAVIAPAASGLATAGWMPCPHDSAARMKVLGLTRGQLLARLARVRRATGEALRGYGQMSIGEIAAVTGLSRAAAARARNRDFSETIVDQLDARRWRRINAALMAEGLRCRHGGRFHTVTGAGADKGRAARLLARRYRASHGRTVATIALGDSANDADMLAAVDIAWLVARPDGTHAQLPVPALRRTNAAGPSGWIEAIRATLPVLRAPDRT